jgi:spermidine synthase
MVARAEPCGAEEPGQVEPGQRGPERTVARGAVPAAQRLDLRLAVVAVLRGGANVAEPHRFHVVGHDVLGIGVDRGEQQHGDHPGPVPAAHAVEEHPARPGVDDGEQCRARPFRHRLQVRQEVQRGADQAVVPVVLPEALVLQAVQVDLDGRQPGRALADVRGALAGLAQVHDGPDAGRLDLVPSGRGDPVSVLGSEEHARRGAGPVGAAQAAEVPRVHQPLDGHAAVPHVTTVNIGLSADNRSKSGEIRRRRGRGGGWAHNVGMGPGQNGADGGRLVVELLGDVDRADAWMLMVDGIPQSYVDLDDPRHLELEYVRRIGHVIDLAWPAGTPLRVLHLGAGGLTLARYVASTRPGSMQLAVEADRRIAGLVGSRLPLDQIAGEGGAGRIEVRIADARAELDRLPADSFDIVIADVFTGGQTPAPMTSAEFVAAAARALARSGVFLANVSDGPPFTHAPGRVAAVRAVFRQVAVVGEEPVLHGRAFGNLVAIGAHRRLPVAAIAARAAADRVPARLLAGADLDWLTAGCSPITDADAEPSPAPPPDADL